MKILVLFLPILVSSSAPAMLDEPLRSLSEVKSLLSHHENEIAKALAQGGAITSISRDSAGNLLIKSEKCSLEIKTRYDESIPPNPSWTVGKAVCGK